MCTRLCCISGLKESSVIVLEQIEFLCLSFIDHPLEERATIRTCIEQKAITVWDVKGGIVIWTVIVAATESAGAAVRTCNGKIHAGKYVL